MKVNSYILIIMTVLVSSPIITINQATFPNQTNISTNNFDDSISLVGGETLKYTINALDWPDSFVLPEGITLPNLAGNQIVQKIVLVDENYDFDENTEGIMVYSSLGVIFTKDTTIGINTTLIDTNFKIPAGAAIFPGMIMRGTPHFNDTLGIDPIWVVLNDDWAEHDVLAEGLGFDVTSTSDEFTISKEIGDGLFECTWRKSDGILNHMLVDNCEAPVINWNMTGGKFEVSFASKEMHGIGVHEGQVIDLKAAEIELETALTGYFTGPTYTSAISHYQSYIDDMLGEVVERIVIDEIDGTFYKASIYVWNFEEAKLELMSEQIIFNAFLGGGMIDLIDNPLYDGYQDSNYGGLGPVITSDWDIYEGYMIIGHTALNVYIEEILAMIDIDENFTKINSFSGSFDLTLQKGYYYFQQSLTLNMEENITMIPDVFMPNYYYDRGQYYNMNESAWLAYTPGGVFAGLGITVDAFYEVYDIDNIISEGSMTVNLKLRLINPDYNPPDPKTDGRIPGYTFLVAIPVLFGFSTLIYLIKKRKIT